MDKPDGPVEPTQEDFEEFMKALREQEHRVIIIRNSAKCLKCGDQIESRGRHDFVSCSCGSVCVDGGKDYLRRVGDPANYEDTSLCKEVEPEPPTRSNKGAQKA